MVLAATYRERAPAEARLRLRRDCPPCSCGAWEGCGNTLLYVTSVLESYLTIEEIGYGQQQAGAEHSGFLPQHGPQEQPPHHALSADVIEFDRPPPSLYQPFFVAEA